MFELINYNNLISGKSYYIRICPRIGYIVTFIKLTTTSVMCTDVELYDFYTKTIQYTEPYGATCFFSKYDTFLRHVSREEYINKLIDVHANNMTNKILQRIIDDNFIYI
jgi:hypothetical protein